ncbi:hypothetical protein FACS189490_09420 [Clostridia bacterium]|nr:hypothetical protein FACS189490_09420 [Clostridia bacterium]
MPGDIVTIDISPYVEPFHAVIVTVGDNRDCCCVQAAWVNGRGVIDVAALKHNLFFMLTLSPLYRLARFGGELPEREAPLYALSEELYAAPEAAEAVYEKLADAVEERRGNRD